MAERPFRQPAACRACAGRKRRARIPSPRYEVWEAEVVMDPLLFLVGALALALVFTATLLKSCKGQLTRSNQELNEERGKVAAAHEAVAEHKIGRAHV